MTKRTSVVTVPGHNGSGDLLYPARFSAMKPVKQHPIAVDDRRWWVRGDDGVLWVRCLWYEPAKTRSGSEYERVWVPQPAPIPGWDDPPPDPLYPYRTVTELPDRSPNIDRITCALDYRGLYGPEVDEALGVSTPCDETVDAWEAGTIVPTHDEIRRLAVLTGMLPAWFYAGTLPKIEGAVFICPGGSYTGQVWEDTECPSCGRPYDDGHAAPGAEQLPLDLGDG